MRTTPGWALSHLPPKGVRSAWQSRFVRAVAFSGQLRGGKMSAAAGACFVLRAGFGFRLQQRRCLRACGAPVARHRSSMGAHGSRCARRSCGTSTRRARVTASTTAFARPACSRSARSAAGIGLASSRGPPLRGSVLRGALGAVLCSNGSENAKGRENCGELFPTDEI